MRALNRAVCNQLNQTARPAASDRILLGVDRQEERVTAPLSVATMISSSTDRHKEQSMSGRGVESIMNSEDIMIGNTEHLSRLQGQLARLEERFKDQDHRLSSIETTNHEIIMKLNDLQTIIESLAAPAAVAAALSAAAAQQQQQHHHQRPSDRSDTNNNSQRLPEQLHNSSKLHQSLFSETIPNDITSNSLQEAPANQQDQNNNNCGSGGGGGDMSGSSSINSSRSSSAQSSPSMSPIEPMSQSQTTHTSSHHLQQSQQNNNQHHQNHASLHQSLLQHPDLIRQSSLSHLQLADHQQQGQPHHQHHHPASNNGQHRHSDDRDNNQDASSRHSSASVSPSLGHSAISTAAGSPMLGAGSNQYANHLNSQQHQSNGANSSTNSNGVGGNQHHLAAAQQILQAAVAAQQHQHNSQQQDPNIAALAASQFLSALGQLGASGVGGLGGSADTESLIAQSRLLASTLSAGDLASNLGSQVAAAVVAAAAKSGNGLTTGLDLHSGNNSGAAASLSSQANSSSGAPTGQSSPLLQRQHHHLASHNNQQHPQDHSHSTESSPISATAAMAAQLSAVAAAAAHHQQHSGQRLSALPLTSSSVAGLNSSPFNGQSGLLVSQANNSSGQIVHSIPHPHSHHALSHPSSASLLMNNPHYQTVRTKYSTRRYSRRRVGPEEAMADPAIRATAQLKMPVVPKTILIVLRHRLTVQTAITLACARTGERLRKGAIQKKLEAMFREPGAVDAFLSEWDHPNGR